MYILGPNAVLRASKRWSLPSSYEVVLLLHLSSILSFISRSVRLILRNGNTITLALRSVSVHRAAGSCDS